MFFEKLVWNGPVKVVDWLSGIISFSKHSGTQPNGDYASESDRNLGHEHKHWPLKDERPTMIYVSKMYTTQQCT